MNLSINYTENFIPTPPRKSKPRCIVCNKIISVIKMDCASCSKSFCIHHYLPEVHNCSKLYKDDEETPKITLPDAIKKKKLDKI